MSQKKQPSANSKSAGKPAPKKTAATNQTATTRQAPAPRAPGRKPRPGLGRGMDSLITPEATSHLGPSPSAKSLLARVPPAPLAPESGAPALLEVPVADIVRSPWQPRQHFDEEPLRELTKSIRAHGVIQPLICRRREDGGYELIAGERRLRAAIEAQLLKIPIILVEAENRQAAEMAIIENIQRQDLNAIEEAEGYRTLAESFNLTQQDVAERVGKARATVANALRLLDLPDEVKQLVGNGLLSPGHAKVLLGLDSITDQILLGRKCVTEELTVRALERLIKRRRTAVQLDGLRQRAQPNLPPEYVQDLVDRLYRHFSTAIRLTPGVTHENGRHTKGTLEIDFFNNDDLDRILNILGITLD